MRHKVCYAVPRARAWLRPWRSTWMKAAAAGWVWGHKQMSFTTSSTGLLVFCQSSHFNLPDFFHMQLWGTQRKMKKKTQYKVGNCFLVAFDGLPAQATNEQFIFWCAAWHTIDATLKNKKLHGLLYFSTPGITLSSIFSLCPQTQACQNSYLFRRQYFSSLWGLETLFRPGSLEEYKETVKKL